MDLKEKKFIDLMMELCDEGELGSIRRKIQDAVKKFAKKVDMFRIKYADKSNVSPQSIKTVQNFNSFDTSIYGGGIDTT